MKIKQGDAYSIPVTVRLNGAAVAIEDVDVVEFMVGGYRKLYPDDVTYSEGTFHIPLTQAETFSWEANTAVMIDVRVKFITGDVQGIEKRSVVGVVEADSEVVL